MLVVSWHARSSLIQIRTPHLSPTPPSTMQRPFFFCQTLLFLQQITRAKKLLLIPTPPLLSLKLYVQTTPLPQTGSIHPSIPPPIPPSTHPSTSDQSAGAGTSRACTVTCTRGLAAWRAATDAASRASSSSQITRRARWGRAGLCYVFFWGGGGRRVRGGEWRVHSLSLYMCGL